MRWFVLAILSAVVGCTADLEPAYDDFRAQVPPVCKDYCEEKVACERESATGPSDDEAFAAAVHECIMRCGTLAVEGAFVWHTDPSGEFERYYDEGIDGDTLMDGFDCLYAMGAFRCVQGTTGYIHRLNPPVQSICVSANSCLADYGIDFSLFWDATATDIGGTCVRAGSDHIDALFF